MHIPVGTGCDTGYPTIIRPSALLAHSTYPLESYLTTKISTSPILNKTVEPKVMEGLSKYPVKNALPFVSDEMPWPLSESHPPALPAQITFPFGSYLAMKISSEPLFIRFND